MADLSNKQLNEMLQSAFADAAPDKAEEIVSAAKSKNSAITVSIVQENYKEKYTKRAALIAACLTVVIGLAVTLMLVRNNTVSATVCIESDRCIEIALNSDNRPVSLSGPDNMSIQLAQRIDKGATLTQAVDNILDEMRETGSLTYDSNTVLITANISENAEELLEETFDAVRNSFDDSDFNGAILTTVASEDKEIERIARRHRISAGKAEMVYDIIHQEKNLRTDLLCRLSVNDLNLLSFFRSVVYDDIRVYGESRGCIDPNVAIRYASREAGIDDANAVVTLGVDEYGLIYSVTVHGKDRVYIYRLDAQSGDIIAVSQGEDLKTAQMADQNTPSPAPTEKRSSPTEGATESAAQPQMIVTYQNNDPNVSPTTVGNTPDPDSRTSAESPKTPRTASPKQEKPTSPKQQAPPTAKRQAPTTPKKVTPTVKPQTATQAPRATSPPATLPPTQPKRDPAIFTSPSYYTSSGVQSKNPLTSSAKAITVRRIVNGYNIFYDADSFPYASKGVQGGISALVCNRAQFKKLTGSSDSRYDDSYFKTHALYIHMNRDANYHWVKSISAAYMNGSTLCLKNSEPVGYYIPAGSAEADRIYTVVYELNKSDLSDFVNMVEYTD